MNKSMTKDLRKQPIGEILQGDCVEILAEMEENSVDLIFADPPYNLQLENELFRPNMTKVHGVEEDWDQFKSFANYDEFSKQWLTACRRVLKQDATLWVIGSYHNIYRLGKLMQDLGFWILNDVLWIKTNPMPNFRGVRFANAHETLLWTAKHKTSKYTFNHHAMKELNDGLQMRSDWLLPICGGSERIKINGKKAHPTQKPESLLYRIILSSSNAGDIILDPFFGTGTSGAVAKKLHRRWIGIERDEGYIEIAQNRIESIQPSEFDAQTFDVRDRRHKEPRVPFVNLLTQGLLIPGQRLYFKRDRKIRARIKPDGRLIRGEIEGSIHQVGKKLSNGSPCNGWEHWYFENEHGDLIKIDELREAFRKKFLGTA